jgi:hypothetical protein
VLRIGGAYQLVVGVLLVSQRIEPGEKISATGFKKKSEKNGKNSEENQSKQKFVTQERKKKNNGKNEFLTRTQQK